MRKLSIVGASGHGKVVADIALRLGYNEIQFFDDDENVKECLGFPVVGKTAEAMCIDGDKIVAIGNATVRERIQNKLTGVIALIHPNAIIGRGVTIDDGSVVMAGAVINAGATIGKGAIVNTGAIVDHDSKIGDFVHVAIGTHIAGTVKVGNRTWIGAGATIINNLNICGDCMIGAGAVVVNNIEKPGTYVGVPAKEKNMIIIKNNRGGGNT